MDVYVGHIQDGPRGEHAPSPALMRVLARMPDDIRAGFTRVQLVALDGALDANNPARLAINLRISLFGLAYLAIQGGRERRTRARHATERTNHPLHTLANIAFLTGIAVLGLFLGYGLRTMVFEG